ncbi:MAG: hypothetical protein U9Q33_05495 [Campylobacterota bacterium]|nr:hypothetical protein [Campylobacterota bacterium]
MIVSFLEAPTHQKALMKPAIKLFDLMPKQILSHNQMINFSEVLMELDYEEPQWFNEHFESHKLNLEHTDNKKEPQ